MIKEETPGKKQLKMPSEEYFQSFKHIINENILVLNFMITSFFLKLDPRRSQLYFLRRYERTKQKQRKKN